MVDQGCSSRKKKTDVDEDQFVVQQNFGSHLFHKRSKRGRCTGHKQKRSNPGTAPEEHDGAGEGRRGGNGSEQQKDNAVKSRIRTRPEAQ